MKKIAILTIMAVFLIVSLVASADDIRISGLTSLGKAPIFSYGADTYTMQYPVIAVYKSDPGISGARQAKDGNYILHYKNNPSALKGATYCAMGIANKYKGGPRAADANLDKAMACSLITRSTITLTFKNEGSANISKDNTSGSYYEGMIPFIKLADGTQINGGHAQWPNGPFLVKTRNSRVTAWLVDNANQTIIPIGKGARAMFAAQIN